MSLTGKIKRAGLWQTVQIVVQVIAQFGYTAIMARLLTKSDFGLMAIAASFIGFGILFSEAGMGAALIQRKDTTSNHHNAAFQGSVISGLFVFAIFLATAKPISVFFRQPELLLIIKVIGITVVLNSISNLSISILQKHFKFKQTSIVITITTIVGYGLGVFLAFNNWGVWSLVAATLTESVLSTVVFLYLAPVKLSFKIHSKEWKELFSFGSGVILLKVNNYLGNQGLNLILGRIFLPSQLGVFERSNQIKSLPGGYLGNILDTVMFPAMAEIQDEKERLFHIYQQSLGIANSLLIPLSFYLIFFAKEIVLILLGDKWMDAVLPLQIMFIILPFTASGRMADSVIRATGMIYKNVRRKFLFILVLFTTVLTGAYFYGVAGASAGVTFSYLFDYGIMLSLVQNIFKKKTKDIFLRPVVEGIKLSVLVMTITLLLSVGFYNWLNEPVLKFIIISLALGGVLVVLTYQRSSLLGIYLNDFANMFLRRKAAEIRNEKKPGKIILESSQKPSLSKSV